MTELLSFLPLAVALGLSIVVLGSAHYLLLARHKSLGSEARLPRQLLLFILTLASLVLLISVAPLPESTRNQILGLLGVLSSGVIALSSAQFVTNFMAAVMLRVTRPFNVGDFIRVGDYFGKVSERGLFDTEIQTESRELVAIPNASFISQGVSVVRSSGVIVSTQLSLGYDTGYAEVEPLLLSAAGEAGLGDPFVHVMSLDDFAVQYRVAGLLTDVQRILTAHSDLNKQVLHKLHGAGVEIASPSITRHITHEAGTRFLPPDQPAPQRESGNGAEELAFDKAREVEQLLKTREELRARLAVVDKEMGKSEQADSLRKQMEALKARIRELGEKD